MRVDVGGRKHSRSWHRKTDSEVSAVAWTCCASGRARVHSRPLYRPDVFVEVVKQNGRCIGPNLLRAIPCHDEIRDMQDERRVTSRACHT